MTWQSQLRTLVPKKFHRSPRMIDYIDSIGQWLDENPQGKLDDFLALVDIRRVPPSYIKYLSDLIGFSLITFLSSSDSSLRRQVENATDWYKIKGTYRAIAIILYTVELTANVYDLYTSDYSTFIRMNWFALGVDTPTDFDVIDGTFVDGMYKSAHFDIQIELDHYFGTSPSWYLINSDQFTTAQSLVESVRPANTVPHFYARIVGSCSDSFAVNTIESSQVSSVVIQANWQEVSYTFDDSNGTRFLDSSNILDFSLSTFLQTWTKFKVGTGHIGTLPSTIDTDLQNPVFIGTVSNIIVGSTSVLFIADVPISYVKDGITEFGLFDGTLTNLQVEVTHPAVNKVSGYILRYEITVNF